MKTQFLLLVFYAVFALTSLTFMGLTRQWNQAAEIDADLLEQRVRRAENLNDLQKAKALELTMVGHLERIDQDYRTTNGLYNFYVLFAFLATLPLAAYSGQSMRDKLFVNRPVNMPRIVYWTLFGVSTRRTAVRYMWLSVALAFVSGAVALVTPIGFLGLVSLVTAYLYQHAVEWVDTHSYWANKTTPPFSFK